MCDTTSSATTSNASGDRVSGPGRTPAGAPLVGQFRPARDRVEVVREFRERIGALPVLRSSFGGAWVLPDMLVRDKVLALVDTLLADIENAR